MDNSKDKRAFFLLIKSNITEILGTLSLLIGILTLVATFSVPEIRYFLGLNERPIESSLSDEAQSCKAQIIVSTAEGGSLNQVKVLPRRDAPSRPPAVQGATVSIDDQPGTGWVRISYTNSNAGHTGWIQDRYLEFLGECS